MLSTVLRIRDSCGKEAIELDMKEDGNVIESARSFRLLRQKSFDRLCTAEKSSIWEPIRVCIVKR